MAALTDAFRERYKNGESLDHMLPEAFAAIIEADARILGKRPYDVQKMAGIVMHKGMFAEMNTGEGKTLSATMPLYLNAITGKGCVLVTTNVYLAHRDGTEMSEVFNFMGLTCACPKEDPSIKLTDDEKRKMYFSDIVYTTNNDLGFDYLFNNLVKKAEGRFMRDFYYVIVDEADSVLLDMAATSLIVSGAPQVKSYLFELCDFFVSTLEETYDYEVENKMVWLTDRGVENAEKFFGIKNYYSKENFDINRQVTLALRSRYMLKKDKDYVVTSGEEGMEIRLVDSSTGRQLEGVKLRGGLHQAIEIKEHVAVTKQTKTVASITLQNLFLLFEKLSGMSGTIMEAKEEFNDVYHSKIVKIPTNNPMLRKDRKDKFYINAQKQFWEAVEDVKKIHETGQPVLIVLNTVTDTNIFSRLLIRENIPHNVLNANNEFWEAQVISEAGQKNAVTVATSMAGRGTDIKLGPGVKELGGLAVLGIGRMGNMRIEGQARGRSGRQGDPGFSQFYVSLEDDIVGENNDYLDPYINGEKYISKRRIKTIVNRCQKYADESAVMTRLKSVQYDDVIKRQRNLIYRTRNNLLDGNNIEDSLIIEIAEENINHFLNDNKEITKLDLERYILDNISHSLDENIDSIELNDKERVKRYLIFNVKRGIRTQKLKICDSEMYNRFVRNATLSAVDEGWIDLIDYVDQLRAMVSGRASAQRNIMFEYQNEAYAAYVETEQIVKQNIIRKILLSDVYVHDSGRLEVVYP